MKLASFVGAARDWLLNYSGAQAVRNYLNQRITPAAQELFQFGYFPARDQSQLLTAYFSEQELEKMGLLYHYFDYSTEETETIYTFSDYNLIIPYFDLYGKIIAIAGRTVLSEEERKTQKLSKYKNSHFNKAQHLFGLWQAKTAIIKQNAVIVVEGQFDCIQAQMAGLKNTVAINGSSISLEQINLLLRFTDNVILMFDQDEAGQMGMEKVKNLWGKRCNLRSLGIPAGYKDLDEFLSSGEKMVQEWIEMINN